MTATLLASGAAWAQTMPPGQASTGPIEDTSYAAGLPGALQGLMTGAGQEQWRRYLAQRKVFTLYRLVTGFEAGSGFAPSYRLAMGYADFKAGFDAAVLGATGRPSSIGAEFRLVSFSPGRRAMVDALTGMEAQVATAMSDALHNRTTRLPDVPTTPAANAFVAWSEKPHLALRTRWDTLDDGRDYVNVGLSAGILRPVPANAIPAGVEIFGNADYALVRLPGQSWTGLWNPSYGIAVRDQAFRLVNGGPEISRWRWQAGATAGVRNRVNDRVPLAFFVRVRLAPSDQVVYTPLEIAERTALMTLSARRDGGGKWLYGVQAAWLR